MQPETERHPLKPFLPDNARLLMLGSFPPPKTRWCMEFYYPNPQNDMWRVIGLVFFDDKNSFTNPDKTFNQEKITAFCQEKGIAIYDTASAVKRLRGNASDEFLEIVEPTDIAQLLNKIPLCHDICCTGQKSMEALAKQLDCNKPKIGDYIETKIGIRHIKIWRMPSTSRAYPLSIDKKASVYHSMFRNIPSFQLDRGK